MIRRCGLYEKRKKKKKKKKKVYIVLPLLTGENEIKNTEHESRPSLPPPPVHAIRIAAGAANPKNGVDDRLRRSTRGR